MATFEKNKKIIRFLFLTSILVLLLILLVELFSKPSENIEDDIQCTEIELTKTQIIF